MFGFGNEMQDTSMSFDPQQAQQLMAFNRLRALQQGASQNNGTAMGGASQILQALMAAKARQNLMARYGKPSDTPQNLNPIAPLQNQPATANPFLLKQGLNVTPVANPGAVDG